MRATGFISALAAGLAAVTAQGQGTINFQNDSDTAVYCNFVGGQKVPAGTAFMAELLYAPDGTPSFEFDQVAVRIGAPASFGGPLGLAGIFFGGTRTIVNLTPAGGFGLFQVRVWEGRYGSSYFEVIASGQPNAHAGKSAIVRVDTGDPTTIPPGTPASLVAAGFTSFSIGGLEGGYPCVPEPSALALAALALGILWFRRGDGV